MAAMGWKPVSCKSEKFLKKGNVVFPQKISISYEVRNIGFAIPWGRGNWTNQCQHALTM